MWTKAIRRQCVQFVSCAFILAVSACSSDEEAPEEPVANSENQNSAEGENSANSQGENQLSNGSNEGENPSTEDIGATENTEQVAAAPEPPPAPEPPQAPVTEMPTSPSPPPVAATPPATTGVAPQANRFVRYVLVPGAAVHAEPNPGSPTVATLAKGDHILVTEENGWGKIADGRFIKLSDLSNKGVPRDRAPLSWN